MTAERRYGRERSPDPPEETLPKCPVCGQDAVFFYRRRDGLVLGCESCVSLEYAEDRTEDFSDEERD